MLIVSQDKKTIINFDNIVDIHMSEVGDMVRIVIENNEIDMNIGEYKTIERAKEILEEIIKCINTKFIVIADRPMREDEKKFRIKQNKRYITEYDNLIMDYAKDIKYIPGKNVFRMPEE